MTIRQWVRIFSFVLVLIVCLVLTGELVRPKESSFDSFYSIPNDTVDMIIVGSSHVYCGYIPAILWEEYGISAFNIYGWAVPTRTAYSYIIEALKTQTPKVVVLDVASLFYGISANSEEVDDMNYSGNINFRMGFNRYDLMLKDTYESFHKRSFGEVNDITKYHSNWKDIWSAQRTSDPNRFFLRYFGALYTELICTPNPRHKVNKI